jgi:hypothetical protein
VSEVLREVLRGAEVFREEFEGIARRAGFDLVPAEKPFYEACAYASNGVDVISIEWDWRERQIFVVYYLDATFESRWNQKEFILGLDTLAPALDGPRSHKKLLSTYRKHMDLNQSTAWLSANADELTEIFLLARKERLELKKNWKPRRRFLFW